MSHIFSYIMCTAKRMCVRVLNFGRVLAGYTTDLVQDSRRKVMSGQCSAEKSLVLTLMRMLL